jgi:hypothetical protein
MNGHTEHLPNGRQAQTLSDFLPSEDVPLRELVMRIGEKVQKFLDEEPKSEQIRHVQQQTETSLKAIREAFTRYEWV